MGIKEYLNNKKTRKATKKQPDITETLSNTINQLQDYLEKLNNGEIHDTSNLGGRNFEFAESLIQQEAYVVSIAIQPLKNANATILNGRVAEHRFHYDFDGRCDEI